MTACLRRGNLTEMLPVTNTLDQFKAVDLRDPRFIQAALEILKRTNKTANIASLPSNGSLPVVLVGTEYAVKFFPSVYAGAFETEVKALQFLSAREVPKILETGRISNWQYVLMTRLAGHSLKDLWPTLSSDRRHTACRQIGRGLRDIHELNLPDHFSRHAWDRFLSQQKAACVERHTKLGLREALIAQIPSFIESVDLTNPKICFLHTEVMKDHVFFESSSREMIFTGFIDFEPSMVGDADYDFASVGLFLSSGDRAALKAFFEGYEDLNRASSVEFRRKIMAYTLLHKYSNLTWYLQFMPDADSLDSLADLWWAV